MKKNLILLVALMSFFGALATTNPIESFYDAIMDGKMEHSTSLYLQDKTLNDVVLVNSDGTLTLKIQAISNFDDRDKLEAFLDIEKLNSAIKRGEINAFQMNDPILRQSFNGKSAVRCCGSFLWIFCYRIC